MRRSAAPAHESETDNQVEGDGAATNGVAIGHLADLVPIEGAAPPELTDPCAPTLVNVAPATLDQLCYALVHAVQSLTALDPQIPMTAQQVRSSSGKLSAKAVTAMRVVALIASERPAAFAVTNADGTITLFDAAKIHASLDRWSSMQTVKVTIKRLLEVIKLSQIQIGTETRADVRNVYEVAVAIARKDKVMRKALATPRAVFGRSAATRKANAQPKVEEDVRLEKAERKLARANERKKKAVEKVGKVRGKGKGKGKGTSKGRRAKKR